MALAACGGSPKRGYVDAPPPPDAVGKAIADAVSRKDVVAIRSALRAPLSYTGLYFTDPECVRQFPVATTLGADKLDALAQCLVALPLRTSSRDHSLSNVALLEYPPGIEVELRYQIRGDHAWVTAVGFVGRRDAADALPTVSPAALAALEVDGGMATLASADRAALEGALRANGLGYEASWLKLCVNTEGAVTSARVLEATSTAARDVFSARAKQRRFQPFMVEGRPVPVCAIQRVAYPTDAAAGIALLPAVGGAADDSGLYVHPSALRQLQGDRRIVPDDRDRLDFGEGKVVGSFKLCIDESGNVASVEMLASTDMPNYDARIIRGIRTWKYRPFMSSGQPIRACTAVTFIYSQR